METTTVRDFLSDADRPLTSNEAVDFVRASPVTLERWRRLGTGPEFRCVGRRRLYPLNCLRKFAGLTVEE